MKKHSKRLVSTCLAGMLTAGIIGAVPFNSIASAETNDADQENCMTCVTSSDGVEDGITCTCEFTIDEDGSCTFKVIEPDGTENTYTYDSVEDIDDLIVSDDGDISITSENDENGDEIVYVCSECVIDDGEDDDIVNTCEYTYTESDDGGIVAAAE